MSAGDDTPYWGFHQWALGPVLEGERCSVGHRDESGNESCYRCIYCQEAFGGIPVQTIDHRSSSTPDPAPDANIVVQHTPCPICREEVVLLPEGRLAPHQRRRRHRVVRCRGSGVRVAESADSRYVVGPGGMTVIDRETGKVVYRRDENG